MKRIIVAVLLLGIICYIGCYVVLSNIPLEVMSPMDSVYDEGKERSMYYLKKQSDVLGFIHRNFIGNDGAIYTRIKASEIQDETLSESIGLLLNYYLMKDAKGMFDKELAFLKGKMLVNNRFVKWKTGKDIACGAAVDDLRIIRVLLDAYEKWQDNEYLNLAGFLQEALYNYQVVNNRLYEFYDWKADTRSSSIPLCYFDFYTIYRMEGLNANWSKVAQRGLYIVKNGRIDKSPFFYKYYNYDTGEYSTGEEASTDGAVCLTHTLYTVIHLAEMNVDTAFFCSWLKEEMDKGKLFAWYNPETLEPVNNIESTAVYALAAVYADKIGEHALYEGLIQRMLQFMVPDEKSPYFGGFGDVDTREFYSFDNLTALWALALANKR